MRTSPSAIRQRTARRSLFLAAPVIAATALLVLPGPLAASAAFGAPTPRSGVAVVSDPNAPLEAGQVTLSGDPFVHTFAPAERPNEVVERQWTLTNNGDVPVRWDGRFVVTDPAQDVLTEALKLEYGKVDAAGNTVGWTPAGTLAHPVSFMDATGDATLDGQTSRQVPVRVHFAGTLEQAQQAGKVTAAFEVTAFGSPLPAEPDGQAAGPSQAGAASGHLFPDRGGLAFTGAAWVMPLTVLASILGLTGLFVALRRRRKGDAATTEQHTS